MAEKYGHGAYDSYGQNNHDYESNGVRYRGARGDQPAGDGDHDVFGNVCFCHGLDGTSEV